MSAAAPASLALAAHVVHYGLLAGGFVAVVVLLWAARPTAPGSPDGGREWRVQRLRDAVHADTPCPPGERGCERPARPRSGPWRQVGAVSSAGAAAVHAAASPNHLEEGLLLGAFFVTAAVAQLAWAGLALRRPARVLWLAGAAGNSAVVLLWLVTRTAGLPFGLLQGPEPVGGWDVAATAFEIVVVLGCSVELRGGRRPEFSPVGGEASRGCTRLARAWLVVVVAVLVALAATGLPT